MFASPRIVRTVAQKMRENMINVSQAELLAKEILKNKTKEKNTLVLERKKNDLDSTIKNPRSDAIKKKCQNKC